MCVGRWTVDVGTLQPGPDGVASDGQGDRASPAWRAVWSTVVRLRSYRVSPRLTGPDHLGAFARAACSMPSHETAFDHGATTKQSVRRARAIGTAVRSRGAPVRATCDLVAADDRPESPTHVASTSFIEDDMPLARQGRGATGECRDTRSMKRPRAWQTGRKVLARGRRLSASLQTSRFELATLVLKARAAALKARTAGAPERSVAR